MKARRAALMGIVTVSLATAATLSLAPQAMAGSASDCEAPDANCLRLSFNSNEEGSQTYLWGSNIPDLASYKFLSLGGGQGYSLKNHAASASNFTPYSITIFYNSNYGGSCDTLQYWSDAVKLHNTYNNDASVKFNYGKSSCYQFAE
jgi:hypothetical protein